MADFKFLRIENPDVMRYLPAFLAEDEHFKSIQDSLSNEHSLQKERLADIARQFFVETATWGLNTWERIYKTEPPMDADYALRRALLKTKMLGRYVMTKKNTELIINQYTSNGRGYVVEDTAPGAITVVLPCGVEQPDLLAKALNEMLPAHLGYSFRLVIHDVDEDNNIDINSGIHQYYGLANIPIGRKTIKLSFPKGYKQNSYTGVALSWGGVKHIGFQSPSDFQYDSFIAFADAKTGRKTIGFDTDDLHYTPLGDLELFFKTGAVYINAGKKHIAACEDRKTVYEAKAEAGITNLVYGTRVIGGLKYLDDMLSKSFGGMYSIRRGTMKIGGLR